MAVQACLKTKPCISEKIYYNYNDIQNCERNTSFLSKVGFEKTMVWLRWGAAIYYLKENSYI